MKMNKNVFCAITVGLMGGLFCNSMLFAKGYSDVTVKEAAALVAEKKGSQSFVILDVRTPGEFDDGHLEGALNLDVKSESFKEELSKLDKKKSYLVYCRSGKRSKKAQGIMKETGFAEAINMKGGFMGWAKEGLPYEK